MQKFDFECWNNTYSVTNSENIAVYFVVKH